MFLEENMYNQKLLGLENDKIIEFSNVHNLIYRKPNDKTHITNLAILRQKNNR